MPEQAARCRHIKLSGHRCATPALDAEPFCYYHTCHRTLRKGRLPRYSAGHVPSLPPLEDAPAIQAAIHGVLERLNSGSICPKEASVLLYGIQIAASLLRLPKPAPNTSAPAEPTISQTVEDINYGLIAAPEKQPAPQPDSKPAPQPDPQPAPQPEPAPEPSEPVALSQAQEPKPPTGLIPTNAPHSTARESDNPQPKLPAALQTPAAVQTHIPPPANQPTYSNSPHSHT